MYKFKVFLISVLSSLILVLAGCTSDTNSSTNTSDKAVVTTEQNKDTTSSTTTQSAETKSKSFVIYVPTDDAKGVKAKTVEASDLSYKTRVESLLKADSNNKYPIFPKDTAVNKVTDKDGILTIDFTKAFASAAKLGDLTNQLEMASLVNTLTESKEVKGIKISIEGKVLKTLGNMDLTDPIKRMDSLIIK